MRHRRHGQGFGARTHQDAAGAAADLRRSRGAQYRIPAGRHRQSVAGRHVTPAIAGYAAYAPPGSEGFFHRILPPAIGLIDACAAEFRRLSVAHHSRNSRARPRFGRRAQFRQPDAADGAPGRDRGRAGAAGRARRARSLERRRLLSARPAKPLTAACSKTSPGAPSASPRRRWNGRAKSSSTFTCCRSGTTSTMSKACAGSTARCAGRARPGARLDAHEPHHPVETAALMNRLWVDGEFTRRREDFMQVETAAAGAA